MSTRPERFVAACVQMRSDDDKARNLDAAIAHVETAAAAGARLVLLPETFSWRGPAARDQAEAEPLAGPTLARLADVARRLRLTLVAGSILERAAGRRGVPPFNTSVVLGPDGERLATYRKVHLFDVSIPGKVEVRESARRGRGADVVTAATPLARLGLSVCYDLRFPELYRALARAGAELLACRRRSRSRPGRRTGRCCCARARSRTSAGCWRRTSTARAASDTPTTDTA